MQAKLIGIEPSILRILQTPLGSRVMRPDFGSRLYELMDRPFDEAFKLEAVSACFEALSKWEPRIEFLGIDFENKTETISDLKLGATIRFKPKETQTLHTLALP